MRRKHTETVSYYGANNIHYTKTCVPRKKDITLIDAERVYLPVWNIVFSISKNKYMIVGTDDLEELNALPSEFVTVPESSDIMVYPSECMICSEDIEYGKYVCNECGIIVCSKDSSTCKVCRNVICKEHTISKRKFLILSNKYCSSCAKAEGI